MNRAVRVFATAVLGLVIGAPAVLAETGPVPPDADAMGGTGPPWNLVIAVSLVPLIAFAIKAPGTRRWITAAGIVAASALVAYAILLFGTVGGWAGRPDEPWTIPGAIAVIFAGLVLAAAVVRRRRPAQSPDVWTRADVQSRESHEGSDPA